MRLRLFAALALPFLLLGCITVQTPTGSKLELSPSTTQIAGDVSTVSGAIAPAAGLIPAPWGSIASAGLIGLSVISGLIAHAKMSRPKD